jgi:hypothetical protein
MSVELPTAADRLRWIVNTSVQDGTAEIKRLLADPANTPADLSAIFTAAREAETCGAARASILAALEAAEKQLAKRAASSLASCVLPSCVCDEVAPSWDRAREILSGIRLALRLSIAGQVMLGMELHELKRSLGFVHGGNRRSEGAPDKTWEAWVRDELNLSRDTADRMIAMSEAARLKLRKLGGEPALLGILDTPPAALDAVQRQTLQAAVDKITDGETQRGLLEELRLVKCHVSPSEEAQRAGGSAQRRQPSEEQLAWNWAGGTVIAELSHVRAAPNYEASLHTLPLSKTEEVPFGLIDYVRELKEIYHTAQAVLDARLKH